MKSLFHSPLVSRIAEKFYTILWYDLLCKGSSFSMNLLELFLSSRVLKFYDDVFWWTYFYLVLGTWWALSIWKLMFFRPGMIYWILSLIIFFHLISIFSVSSTLIIGILDKSSIVTVLLIFCLFAFLLYFLEYFLDFIF